MTREENHPRSERQMHRVLSIIPAALMVFSEHALATEQGEIPAWSLALEKRLQPWCVADCALITPLTAVYKKNDLLLVFVGVRHAFTSDSPTFRAVDAGFAAVSPAIVIVEGFPTRMGESPAPLMEQARKVGSADADDFTRGEAMYAVSLALERDIPFLGGEPTRAEQVEALKRRGYSSDDIAFAYLLGGLSQSLRSGDIQHTRDPKLAEVFERWTVAFTDQYGLKSLSLDAFSTCYRNLFGIELARDNNLPSRSEPGTGSPVALLNQADMVTRDEHLLTTIESQLDRKKQVLVVYGGSHWTTLSQALEKRLGKPKIQPFLD